MSNKFATMDLYMQEDYLASVQENGSDVRGMSIV